jgi:RNA polymerase sigma-70 factor (ECF subfamily)
MSVAASEFNVDQYLTYLTVLARALTGSAFAARFDPSDLVQQAAADAWANRAEFRGDCAEEFKCWLRRILKTTALDMVRLHTRGKRNVGLEVSIDQVLEGSSRRLAALAAGDPTPSSQLRHEESLRRLSDALERLPEAQRQAVSLVHIQGKSLREAAEDMRRTIPSVVGHLRRGMKTLRTYLTAGDRHE